MNNRPCVFIGSSSEGRHIAEAIQLNIDAVCDSTIWSQGVFGLSEGTLEVLVEEIQNFDFAILVLTPDDLVESRGETKFCARDNVLLEFGLCIGTLGRKRTFAVYDRLTEIRIPSDLAGVTLASYQLQKAGNVQASVGAASTKIKNTITRMGSRERTMNEMRKSAFVAVPMNAFKEAGTPEKYGDFRDTILPLLETLRKECAITKLHCAVENIKCVEDFELPGASLDIDMEKIREHEYFILIYTKLVYSKSILIETGMALALGKKCIICVEKGAVLPFILQDASSAARNVKRIDFEDMNGLWSEFKKNKKWLFA
jgi:hypothetical protein